MGVWRKKQWAGEGGIEEGFMDQVEFELDLEGEIECGHTEMW